MSEKQKRRVWFWLLVFAVGLSLLPLSYQILKPRWNLQKQDIENIFRESLVRITPTRGDVLEVAVLDTFDTITRKDSRTLFEDLIYLGTTVSEIKVKVTYRYHILLSDPWAIAFDAGVLRVTAPQIRASLPPAIHTDQMEKRSEAGWLRFNQKENLEKLEASLTPTLGAMALTPSKRMLVEGASRKVIEEFVRAWILPQESWKELNINEVVVIYPHEKTSIEANQL